MWHIVHDGPKYLITTDTIYFKVHIYEKETRCLKYLHQLVKKAGLEQTSRLFSNEHICKYLEIYVFNEMYLH